MAELCPQCGSVLPAGAPGQMCPQCLLVLGLGEAPAAEHKAPPTRRRASSSSVSAVLTLPSTARGGRTATFALGSGPQISTETEELLRGRLQVGCWVIFVGLLLFVVRDLWWGTDDAFFVDRVVLLMFYGVSGALLRSNVRLTLRQLRLFEAAIVWLVSAWFAYDRYYYTGVAIDDGDATGVLWAMAFSVMVYFAFLSAYGFLAPNTWRRALRMTMFIAATPFLVLLALALTHPGADSLLLRAATTAQLTSMALVLVVGVMITTWGSDRIHTLRVEAFEAKRLGQYRLTEQIGAGGMGEVWKAEHRLLVRPAAIKLIKPEMVDAHDTALAQDLLSSFAREAQATASLRSTHTVELYDFGVTGERALYYVMELLDGLDCETLVKDFGPLHPARVANLLEQACDSLADAHHHGLVHRDIKPANVYVCTMGRRYDFVKILDFGLVKSRRRREKTGSFGNGKDLVVGTPSFMAPEAATGEIEVDGRSDIYALGCVGYWLLTGRLVFEGGSAAEIVAMHVKSSAVPPSQRTERPIPDELEGIIMRCLEKDPGRRPQSGEQLAELLIATGLPERWTQPAARGWWHENLAG